MCPLLGGLSSFGVSFIGGFAVYVCSWFQPPVVAKVAFQASPLLYESNSHCMNLIVTDSHCMNLIVTV